MLSPSMKDLLTSVRVALSMLCFYFLLFYVTTLTFYLLFTSYWWLGILILSWTIYDRHTGSNGGRKINFIYRYHPLSLILNDYLDMKLIKTADLNPEKNYILGYHPHGSSFGLLTNFLSPVTGYEKKFPGMTSYLAALSPFVHTPLIREVAMAMGVVDCGERSFHSLLHDSKGVALTIAVGGSAEVLDMHPRMMRITLKRRKGFVRMALKYGASLVPVVSFGDNDLFDQLLPNPPGSLVRRIQEYLYRKTGGSLLVVHWGRIGGLVPYRVPVHTVVGRPIDVDKTENPTPEQVDALHALYISELELLFNEYKHKYPGGDSLVLEIV